MPSVAEIAKKLNKEFKDEKLAIKADVTPTYERMPTGAFGFDYPYHLHIFHFPKSAQSGFSYPIII